mmetsp:Transcript_85094/g.214509  ORF Transcript_85094/g.214509 Transcript_85094/m.214509 type:complete len:216 (-) Transcript_85094:1680-2327(-)
MVVLNLQAFFRFSVNSKFSVSSRCSLGQINWRYPVVVAGCDFVGVAHLVVMQSVEAEKVGQAILLPDIIEELNEGYAIVPGKVPGAWVDAHHLRQNSRINCKNITWCYGLQHAAVPPLDPQDSLCNPSTDGKVLGVLGPFLELVVEFPILDEVHACGLIARVENDIAGSITMRRNGLRADPENDVWHCLAHVPQEGVHLQVRHVHFMRHLVAQRL